MTLHWRSHAFGAGLTEGDAVELFVDLDDSQVLIQLHMQLPGT